MARPRGVTGATLQVEGYREFQRAIALTDRQTRKAVRDRLRPVGDAVKADAAGFMLPYSSRTAAGFRTRVQQTGVAVAQSVKKTTGKHPEYGALQMRVLVHAVGAHEAETEQAVEHALDDIIDLFDRA